MSNQIEFGKTKQKKKKKYASLIVKNHIKYIVCVVAGKHKFLKTFKKNKKWHIPVLLYATEVLNQEAIDKICDVKVEEIANYQKIKDMASNKMYHFQLSRTQYEIFKSWCSNSKIGNDMPFSFQRIGVQVNTRYIFSKGTTETKPEHNKLSHNKPETKKAKK